jgi:hypothetical protein
LLQSFPGDIGVTVHWCVVGWFRMRSFASRQHDDKACHCGDIENLHGLAGNFNFS